MTPLLQTHSKDIFTEEDLLDMRNTATYYLSSATDAAKIHKNLTKDTLFTATQEGDQWKVNEKICRLKRNLLIDPQHQQAVLLLSDPKDLIFGKGDYKRVERGIDLITGQIRAVARITPKTQKEEDYDQIYWQSENEIAIMKCLKTAKHVVQLQFVVKTPKEINLVMEACELGTLHDAIKNKTLNLKDQLSIFEDCLVGLFEIHEKGIYHRDIKPSNILLSVEKKRIQAKFADFGLASFCSNEQTMRMKCGTYEFLSPEKAKAILEKGKMSRALWMRYGRSGDIWALGVTFFSLFTSQFFLYKESKEKLLEAIAALSPSFLEQRIQCICIPDPYKALLITMLQIDPTLRMCKFDEFFISLKRTERYLRDC